MFRQEVNVTSHKWTENEATKMKKKVMEVNECN